MVETKTTNATQHQQMPSAPLPPSGPPPALYPNITEPPPKYEDSQAEFINRRKQQAGGSSSGVGGDALGAAGLRQTTVVVTTTNQALGVRPSSNGPTVIVEPVFGKDPMPYQCPHCGEYVLTNIEPKAGRLTWLMCSLMFCFVTPFLAWIPCCTKSCQDIEHHCPNCDGYIGTFKRMS